MTITIPVWFLWIVSISMAFSTINILLDLYLRYLKWRISKL